MDRVSADTRTLPPNMRMINRQLTFLQLAGLKHLVKVIIAHTHVRCESALARTVEKNSDE